MLIWIDNWRVQTKLLSIGVIGALGMLLITGIALSTERDRMLTDRTDKMKALLEVVSGFGTSLQDQVQAGRLSQAEAETMLHAMITKARYDEGNYVSVFRGDGTAFAFPSNPKLERTSFLNLKDPDGVMIIQVAREIIRKDGQGWFNYRYPRAGQTDPLRKASYTKLVGFGDMFAVTGVYLDDVDAAFLHGVARFGLVSVPLLLLMLVVTLVFQRSVGNGLSLLSGAMMRMTEGDLAVDVPGVTRRDELGMMARSVLTLKDAGLDKQRLERQAEQARITAAAERDEAERMRQALADGQATVVQSLAEALRKLSGGDLTCDIEGPFTPEYERLRIDFNAAVGELRTVMGTIIGNIGAIRSGTGEISQAADDLSRRTEQQAASLEQTAAALDEITATVRKTAEGAASARTAVGSTKSEAESGEGVVRTAVAAMTEIEASAKKISQIIGVIDEIAFQTNLLALNAGVEAARAGDAGRGFAVVASEVRALAQRSADAAKEIKGLISNSSAQVDRGVTLVSEAGNSLGRIVHQVTQINSVVVEIAASAQEQSIGLSEVNTAVNQMDQVTQQNAAMVEQSTAASRNLAGDTAELERLTSRFNVGAQAARSVAAASASMPKAKVVPLRKTGKPLTIVASNTRKSTADQESWREF